MTLLEKPHHFDNIPGIWCVLILNSTGFEKTCCRPLIAKCTLSTVTFGLHAGHIPQVGSCFIDVEAEQYSLGQSTVCHRQENYVVEMR